MSSGYIEADGIANEIKKMYFGVDGVARKVQKAYIGVNGIARCFYSTVEKADEQANNNQNG